MKVFELLTEEKYDRTQVQVALRQWRKLVNMPTHILAKIVKTEDGKIAGLTRRDVKRPGKWGAARMSLRMKTTSFSEWTTVDLNWMYRQIAVISKILKSRGTMTELKDGKRVPSEKLKMLWDWGHVPNSHSPAKYGELE